MDSKFLLLLTACFLTISIGRCQNGDELPITEEKDNQFPSDFPPENDTLEGSGLGAVENPTDVLDTTTSLPPLEPQDNEVIASRSAVVFSEVTDILLCPDECTCSQESEGEEYKLTVDCSGKELVELPAPIDTRTTVLNLQNNKLTELPKSILELKKLKVLNVNNNILKNLAYGTVSELPELRTLNLANNKLLQVPQELKNGFGLTKLEELNFGGNDIRDMLQTEIFSHFTSLQKLTLPEVSDVYVEQLCRSLSNLHTICTENCEEKAIDCRDVMDKLPVDGLIPVLAGELPATLNETDSDPSINNQHKDNDFITSEVPPVTGDTMDDLTTINLLESAVDRETPTNAPEVFRAAVMNASIETTNEKKQDMKDATSNPDGGGVDKSVVGVIIAVMIVVVAALVIKKNWNSIRNTFSSSPRPASEHPQAHTNGTTPEEMPLQEKSPV